MTANIPDSAKAIAGQQHSSTWRLALSHIQRYTAAVGISRAGSQPLGLTILEYQASRVEEIVNRLQQPGSLLLQDPTGTGKTLVALVAARVLLDIPADSGPSGVDQVLVIAPNQAVADLWNHRSGPAGFAAGEVKVQVTGMMRAQTRHRLMIVTRKSMPNPLPVELRRRLLVIVDEAHRGLQSSDSPAFDRISEIAADGRVLLVTATPFQLSASGFAQMLAVATHKSVDTAARQVDRRAIEEYTESLVGILHARRRAAADPADAELKAAEQGASTREQLCRPRMKVALADHVMSTYDRSKAGLPDLSALRVPAKASIDPGSWSRFFHVARLIPELIVNGQSSDSYLRMLASSHEAFRTTDVFEKFEQSFPESPLLLVINARTAPGSPPHPKVAATAELVARRLTEGRHVLVFCVYVETQIALRDAIRARTNQHAAEAPLSAAAAKRIHGKRFGREPGDGTEPLALIVRDNLSEGIDLDGGRPCIVHHDLSWNPARFDQRMGRITRASSGFMVPSEADVFIPV